MKCERCGKDGPAPQVPQARDIIARYGWIGRLLDGKATIVCHKCRCVATLGTDRRRYHSWADVVQAARAVGWNDDPEFGMHGGWLCRDCHAPPPCGVGGPWLRMGTGGGHVSINHVHRVLGEKYGLTPTEVDKLLDYDKGGSK